MKLGTAELLMILPENKKAAMKKHRLFSLQEAICYELCI